MCESENNNSDKNNKNMSNYNNNNNMSKNNNKRMNGRHFSDSLSGRGDTASAEDNCSEELWEEKT